jgi:hypothetical protein
LGSKGAGSKGANHFFASPKGASKGAASKGANHFFAPPKGANHFSPQPLFSPLDTYSEHD